MDAKDKKYIVISPRSIALFTLIPLVLYFLWSVRDILFSLLIAFILMSSLRPGVDYLVSKKVPRGLSIGLVFSSFILFFLSLISIIIPPIIYETTNLIRSFPFILEEVDPSIQSYIDLSNLSSYIPNFTNNLFGLISGLFSNTLFVIATLFFSLYFLIENNLFNKFFRKYIPKERAEKISKTLSFAERRMASWFWGELALMTIVGALTYLGLVLIGVKYALPLAVLAGLLEVVPNIGPVISAIPAVIIGFSASYFAGFSVLALYIIVQQLENNLIVPMIMKKAVGINPILTLIALLVGGHIGGVLGVLLAIPILLFTETIIQELLHSRVVKQKGK